MTSRFTQEQDLAKAVRVSWLGHSMFLLEDGAGNRLVTDPYDGHVGYPLPKVEATIVLVSHDHTDHCNVGLVQGSPLVVRDEEPREHGGISIRGFRSYHDNKGGAERGRNIIYRWTMQGMTFVHLGDLGHLLDEGLAGQLAGADVLFVPVGGTFTIDADEAFRVVGALKPRIAVPMHFKTDACTFPIQSEEPFVSRFAAVERPGKSPVYLSGDNLPEPTLVLVMDYI